MLLGLGLAFVVGSLAIFVLLAVMDAGRMGRRFFYTGFPAAVAATTAGLAGLVAACVPTVDPDVAVLVGLIMGYLTLRVSDERLHGRPRVFAAGQVVVVPERWRDDLV